jgi:UDP-N-acetylglucosamine--N-acetylmuramyl-(pentapeptide) pyrophosphoryl-undecaprenol N-acetylglucosamine transferase
VSFEETASMVELPEKTEVVGNPIRREALAKPGKRSLFLIIGGSQGALPLVKIAPQVLRLARAKGRRLVVIAGRFADSLRENLRGAEVIAFTENMGDIYGRTIVALARAGAGTTFELAANGVPAVLVPFRYATGHQRQNAKAWEERETAVTAEESSEVDRVLYLLDLISVKKVKLRGLGEKSRRKLAGAVDRICRRLISQS